MLRRLLLVALLLVPAMSCYYMGCYSLKDACYECCKENLKSAVKIKGGKRAFDAREPCRDECVDWAKKRGKDAYWVERHTADGEACMLGTVDYFAK